MNSKRKGSGGEREVAELLRVHGYDAHRNEQRYIGGLNNPDVDGLPGYHIEVKRTEKFSLYDALRQAQRDADGKAVPIVCHRRNRQPWVVVMTLEDFLRLEERSGSTCPEDSTPKAGQTLTGA